MKILSKKDIQIALTSLDGWSINKGLLNKTYTLNSFMDVMSLANLVSDKSEKMNHHPKIIIEYNKIEFRLITHSINGISDLDFQLANFIHETYDELFI